MKRNALAAPAAFLLASMIALLPGCGKPYSPKNPVSIEIWHYYNGPQKVAFDGMVSQFNETVGLKEGITVEAFSQGNVSDLTQKITDAANNKVGAEEIPDVFAAYADTAYQIDQLGLAAELDAYLTEQELDEYIPAYIEEGRFDAKGSLKIFPVAKSSEIMMVNKTDWDRFAAADGAQLSELETMEGLCDVARRYHEWTDSLTPQPNDGKAFFGWDAMANYFLIGAKQMGVELFDAKGGQVTYHLDEPVLRRLWDCYYVPYVSGWFTSNGRFRSDDAKTGDIIALVGSTSGSAYFPDTVMIDDNQSYPIESVVMPPPHFEGGSFCLVQQGAGMVVTKSDEAHERAATEFLRWFTDAQRNLDFSILSGYLPVKKEANDVEMMRQTLDRAGDLTMNLRNTLLTSVEMIGRDDCELYTSKAFEGGTQARAVLENSLLDKAKADREEIAQRQSGGASRQDALFEYLSDENFQGWLKELQTGLNEAVTIVQ